MNNGRHRSNGHAARSGPIRLRTVIIGAGKICEQHLGPLSQRHDVDVVGICDLSPALARFTAERFGVKGWFTDHRRMLDETNADVVHILTPAATHVPLARECLERGLHALVEKPVALSNAEFRGLWDVAQAQGRHLIENHNYRFNEPIQRLQQLVAAGRIGVVDEVEVRMILNVHAGGRYADANLPSPSHRLPAGVIHEFLSHMSYLMLQFLPTKAEEPVVEYAAWRNCAGGSLFKYDDLDALISAGPARGRLRFSSRQWPESFSVEVRGTAGAARAELFQPSMQLVANRRVPSVLQPLANSVVAGGALARSGFAGFWKKVQNWTPYEGLDRFLNLTYDALPAGTELPVRYEHMDSTTRLIDALLAGRCER